MALPRAFVLNHIAANSGNSKQLNLSTLAVVRSLARRGIPVTLVTTNESDAVIDSRWCRSVEYCPYLYDDEQSLVEFMQSLGATYPGTKVLIPAIDECAYFVGKYYSELEPHFQIPAPKWEAVRLVNNKRHQYELAESLGIAIPETYFPQSVEDVVALAARITNYPYVIKPNVSFEWKLAAMRSKAKGKKGIKVDSAKELIARAEEIFVPGYDFMVQEVIGGRDERLVSFLSYFDQSAQPNSYFVRKKIRQAPVDFGYCTMTESCHNDVVVDQSTRLLNALAFQGISGVEWKLDPVTETYKLIEINARAVNTTGCAIAAGVDLPAIAYFDAIDQPLEPVTDWQDGCRWAWLSMDFWAGRQLVGEGKLTTMAWLKDVSGIRADAVFAWDDWLFSTNYYTRFFGSALSAKFKKLFVRRQKPVAASAEVSGPEA
ncbi:ATP-grasp domain-containing protein [Marinimicrobium sp. ABcell2]|uniref:carboxylate--amine ligase n=1 Tax=Marinimicrobium sp. ABcell2 TaxID=3069751 RepID=UPI0027B4DE18|nr:ATP-grasp domain-containing protein [Marinimicrobium sp. ABcell2]MDQ2076205.1 ATP-grasp domain-containing protein [Marinimicrobium sp. ABcell2]